MKSLVACLSVFFLTFSNVEAKNDCSLEFDLNQNRFNYLLLNIYLYNLS